MPIFGTWVLMTYGDIFGKATNAAVLCPILWAFSRFVVEKTPWARNCFSSELASHPEVVTKG